MQKKTQKKMAGVIMFMDRIMLTEYQGIMNKMFVDVSKAKRSFGKRL